MGGKIEFLPLVRCENAKQTYPYCTDKIFTKWLFEVIFINIKSQLRVWVCMHVCR